MNEPASTDFGRSRDDAFVEVWEAQRSRLIRFARNLSGSVDSASIVDEAFARAWRDWAVICDGKPVAWLYRVTHNLVIDEAKRIKRENLRPIPVAPTTTGDEAIELRETQAAIRQLPPRERCAIALQQVGYELNEIATIMATRRRNVSYLLAHARKTLTRKVGNEHRRQRKRAR